MFGYDSCSEERGESISIELDGAEIPLSQNDEGITAPASGNHVNHSFLKFCAVLPLASVGVSVAADLAGLGVGQFIPWLGGLSPSEQSDFIAELSGAAIGGFLGGYPASLISLYTNVTDNSCSNSVLGTAAIFSAVMLCAAPLSGAPIAANIFKKHGLDLFAKLIIHQSIGVSLGTSLGYLGSKTYSAVSSLFSAETSGEVNDAVHIAQP